MLYIRAALISLFIVGAAYAKPISNSDCGERAAVAWSLTENGLVKAGVGVSEDGNLLEFYSTPDGAIWLVVLTKVFTNNSVSCAILSGTDWRTMGRLGDRV